MCVLLVALLCINSAPAFAANSGAEFDFSASDTLGKYSSYTKKVADNGISYVDVTNLNRIDTTRANSFADYRYGAYLLSSNESQYYSINNRNYGGALPANVLTIYADPEVQFQVVDTNNSLVADHIGQKNAKKINYYRKSTDNGHNVYYIEFVPAQSGTDQLMIQFSTNSTTVQPHYSLWFGHPLTKSDTRSFLMSTSILRPKTTSTNFGSYSPYIQDAAWVTSVTLEKQRENDIGCITKAYISVATPETTTFSDGQSTASKTIVFNFDVNRTSANTANGIYNFKLSNVTWNPLYSGAHYVYEGRATVAYLYAFGY